MRYMTDRIDNVPSIAERLSGLVNDPVTGEIDPYRIQSAVKFVAAVEQILRKRKADLVEKPEG